MQNNEYIQIQETTNKYKKQKYWKIAVGLNQVDNLKPSVLWANTLLQKIIKKYLTKYKR